MQSGIILGNRRYTNSNEGTPWNECLLANTTKDLHEGLKNKIVTSHSLTGWLSASSVWEVAIFGSQIMFHFV